MWVFCKKIFLQNPLKHYNFNNNYHNITNIIFNHFKFEISQTIMKVR